VRPGVCARPATGSDLDDLAALCLAARTELQVGPQLCTDDPQHLREQLGLLLACPGGTVIAGTMDDEVAGLLLARVIGPGLFCDATALTIEALYVRHDARRQGLGHALLFAAASLAQQAGADEVYASPLPGARGMLRFLARVGFAPTASYRVVATSVLQRRLAQDPAATRAAVTGRFGRQRLDGLIARRRQARVFEFELASADADVATQLRSSITMQVNRAVQIRRPASSRTTTS